MRFVLAVGALILTALAGGSPALAVPKLPKSDCGPQQLTTAAARQCFELQYDDAVHDRSTIHYLYCSSTGAILCCKADSNGNTIDHSCSVIGRKIQPDSTLVPVPKDLK